MPNTVSLTFPDGSVRDYDAAMTGAELAESISKSLAKKSVAVALDGVLQDLSDPLARSGRIEIVTRDDPRALELIRHDTAHVLAEAVQELWPGTQVTIGPWTDSGFYYNLDVAGEITEKDLKGIQKEMGRICKKRMKMSVEEVSPEEAARRIREQGEPYKLEILESILERDTGAPITIWHTGEPGEEGSFWDLCAGPHVEDTGKINPKATGRRFNKGHKAPVQNYPLAIQPGQGAPDGNTWTGGSWNGASWSGGSWSGASWSSASWSGASWSGASWSGASWSSASWSGASWSGASWSGASWSGASWSGASWSSVAWADAPLAATAAVVDTVEEAALDAVLEREDEILDVVALQDDDLVDQLLDNEDELHESLLTDNDAIVESILEDTSPAVDPTIVADVALVDAVVDIVTADISPVDQFVAQQAVIEMEVTP